MKKFTIAAIALATLVGCDAPKDSTPIGQLKQQKDSLKELYADI